MTNHKHSSKPAFMRFDPKTGEATVYHDEADVPEGHLDHHPQDPSFAAPAKPKAAGKTVAAKEAAPPSTDLSRKEIRNALDEGNFDYDKTDTTENLAALLVAKLKEFLTSVDVAFEPDASAKTLLGLLPKE